MKFEIIPNAHAVCVRDDNDKYVKDLVVSDNTTVRFLYKLKGKNEWQEKTIIFNQEPASIVFDGMVVTETKVITGCPDNKIDCFTVLTVFDIRHYPSK